jgi:hypothetical protein
MGERSIISIAKLGVICWTWLELAYDGLERGFKFFNGLEGSVCAMCAPEDQRKSHNSQREQAEMNALRCQLWPMFREGERSRSADREFVVKCWELNSRNEPLWKWTRSMRLRWTKGRPAKLRQPREGLG